MIVARKPQKPSPDFPLFAHSSGKWAKKIKGQLRYFGRWEDPDAALREYESFLQSAEPASSQPAARTVAVASAVNLADACNCFLAAQETRCKQGELTTITFKEYLRTCKRLIAHFGRTRHPATLGPSDFASYRTWRSKTCNLVAVGNEVTRVRTIFKWIGSYYRFREPIDFGPDFKKASAKARRRHRREAGKKLFSAEQIRLILDECGIHLRAMVLLGINCGFGNTDCATLPLDAVDLDAGWVHYPRPKTEVDRSVPLWPETIEALRTSLKRRYTPREEAEGRFFVMVSGKPWDNSCNPICKQFRQVMDRAEIRKGGFYWLRHTFETIGGDSKDQVAVNAIMGHVDSSMAAVYREHIAPERLEAVVNHVRTWLFGNE
jgi:integrase